VTHGSAKNRSTASTSGEITAISQRVIAMMIFRVSLTCVLLAIALLWGGRPPVQSLLLAAGYLAAAAALGSAVLTGRRTLAVRSFGLSMLIDAGYLQYLHEVLGHRLSIDIALAANLAAVCLLASFRTGVKIGVWQSLLLLIALRGEQAGLFPTPAAMAGLDRELVLATDTLLLWGVVLTTAAAAAVNERELRRRRYDAEALAAFASALHADERTDQVARRLLGFVADELDAGRGLVIRVTDGGPMLIAGLGPTDELPGSAAPGSAAGQGSALFGLAVRSAGATLVMRLDPVRDPWLDALLPNARRLVVLPVGRLGGDAVWLVFECAPGGGRVERRMLSSATQAAATGALALSRAELLQQAERAAAIDGLTGVANRRTLDAALAALQRQWAGQGVGFAVVLLDVDRFKVVNDQHGHQVGDRVLQSVARRLAQAARPQDLPARYGGEEFCLLLPDTDQRTAARIAQQLCTTLRETREPIGVTASFGIAAVPENASSAQAAVAAADDALIMAKETGRDRVVPAPRLQPATGG
jgi:two-component system cell cycle response regulator